MMRLFVILILIFLSLGSCKYGEIMSEADPETETAVDTIPGPLEVTTRGAELGEFEVHNTAKTDLSQYGHVVRDLPYSTPEDSLHTLEIVYPKEAPAPYKAVLLLEEQGSAVYRIAKEGYALIRVNYQESNEEKSLHDLRAAIRSLRANSGAYNLDTDSLLVVGGGDLGQLLGLAGNEKEYERFSPGNQGYSDQVQGVVSWYKPAGTEVARTERSIEGKKNGSEDIISRGFPPFLILYSESSGIEELQNLQHRINDRVGAKRVRLQEIEEGDAASEADAFLNATLDFLDKILYNGSNPYRSTH